MLTINPNVGVVTTNGDATLTATLLAGQVIARAKDGGPAGDFADIFDTAANLAAAFGANVNGFGGVDFFCTYINNTNHRGTLTTPVGGNFALVNVIGSGGNVIPGGTVAILLISIAPGGAVTVTVLYYFAQA